MVKTGQPSFSWQEGQTVGTWPPAVLSSHVPGQDKGALSQLLPGLWQAAASSCHQRVPDMVGLDRAWALVFTVEVFGPHSFLADFNSKCAQLLDCLRKKKPSCSHIFGLPKTSSFLPNSYQLVCVLANTGVQLWAGARADVCCSCAGF